MIYKIKIDEKSEKYFYLIHWICDGITNLKVNSVSYIYLIISKINGYIEESNKNKYLALVTTDESNDTLKKYEELWNKIRDLIKSIINNSDNYHKKYMKIKFNSDDDLPYAKDL